MNLGFYYHIPIHSSPSGLKIPAYLGVFLDSLASEVTSLTLFMHEANDVEIVYCDYILKSNNIKYTSLGVKTPAWDRFLWPSKSLRSLKAVISKCDVMLVRAPSPLAPRFYHEFKDLTKIAYLVVGDYAEGIKHLKQVWWKKLPAILLNRNNDKQLRNVLRKSLVLVNSRELYNKYHFPDARLYQVKTSTLSTSDFYSREDTCDGVEIKLLYTGSFSYAKGLLELMEAFQVISSEYTNTALHLVGWEYDVARPVEKHLSKLAFERGIKDKVHFHGFKTVGPDLNLMYRMADIYIIPSYHEGFPRTIWEAMANSMPVIASRVGSIPHFLKDQENVFLIEPKSKEEIIKAIHKIILNHKLRKQLISNGYALAKNNTVEIHTKQIVNILANSEK